MAPQPPRELGPCPPEADLICATSGELPPEESAVVRQHLALCPICGPKMCAILDTLAALAQPDDESPERFEADLAEQRALMDAARAGREAMSPRRWLVATAMFFLFLVGLTLLRTDVDADEVLRRATTREPTVTMPADLWLWTFSDADEQAAAPGENPNNANSANRATNTQGANKSAGESYRATIHPNPRALPPQAVQVLQAHGFDLSHPLSLEKLQAWRAQHPDRREQLTHRDKFFAITSTTKGSLHEVEVVIDEKTYQLVKQAWVIAGMGRVVCERVKLAPRQR